jgi:hypothetical protein
MKKIIALLTGILCALFLQSLLDLGGTGTVGLLLLLLLQGVDDAVDGLEPFLFGHLGQQLQRVLQIDGIGVGDELVEHL